MKVRVINVWTKVLWYGAKLVLNQSQKAVKVSGGDRMAIPNEVVDSTDIASTSIVSPMFGVIGGVDAMEM